MNIGKRLKEERERLKLSQTALGDIAGMGKTTVIAWERGTAYPNAEFLEAAANFGVDVYYVITGNRLDNAATTPIELSYLRLCRALPDQPAKMAGNAALLGVLASYGIKLTDSYVPAANDNQNLKVAAKVPDAYDGIILDFTIEDTRKPK